MELHVFTFMNTHTHTLIDYVGSSFRQHPAFSPPAPAPSAVVERVLISDPIAARWLVMWQRAAAIKSRGVLSVWSEC